ncbi:MAG: hypothetical protein AB7G93_16900 [Bdellovibrionales bacterium]
MRVEIVLSLCLLVGCIQTENSNSLDASTYGGDAARSVVGTNCSSCHAFHTQSNEELIASGLIVAGDSQNSKLYYRLSGSDGPNGPKNMPTGGALSSTDLQTIKNWIDSL